MLYFFTSAREEGLASCFSLWIFKTENIPPETHRCLSLKVVRGDSMVCRPHKWGIRWEERARGEMHRAGPSLWSSTLSKQVSFGEFSGGSEAARDKLQEAAIVTCS